MALRRQDVVTRLAAVVGEERAAELVTESLAALGVTGWSDAIADRVIDKLAATPGLVGAAARRLRAPTSARATAPSLERPVFATSATSPHRDPAPHAPTPPEGLTSGSPTFVKLTAMLGASLGEAKARALVEEAARRRGITRESLGHEDAFLILEDLAREPGLVGTVARFAKARAHFELM